MRVSECVCLVGEGVAGGGTLGWELGSQLARHRQQLTHTNLDRGNTEPSAARVSDNLLYL